MLVTFDILRIKMIAASLLMLFSFSAFGQSNELDLQLTEEEKTWIADHPVITSTNEMEWAPLDFVHDGEPLGFSIDYLNLVSSKVGLKIEYINGYTWQELLNKLKKREIDMAQSIIQTPDRSEYLKFTRQYLDLPMVYFGRVGADRIQNIDDLKKKRIGVVVEAVPAIIYENDYPELNIVKFESTLEALKALSAGSIDVHADILPVSQYMIRTSMLPGIEVIGDRFYPETKEADYIRFAARSDWPILISILEKGMAVVTEEEFLKISDKWQTMQSSISTSDIELSLEERLWLSENNVIRVAADPTEAPLEFIDENGNISGVTGAYLDKIAKLLNVKFVSAGSTSWTDSISKVRSGEADVVTLVTATPAREEYLTFTEPYINVVHMIFAREGEEIYGNLDGLLGRKVAQVEGFAVKGFIERDHPEIEIVSAPSVADALQLVATGEADAYVGSMPMATYQIASEGLSNLTVVGDTPYRGENGFAIRKDLPHLASAMQKALSHITADERGEISRQWLGLQQEQVVDYQLVFRVVLIAAIIVAAILLWNYSLRREVARRTVVEKKLVFLQERAESAQADAEAANAAKSNFLANMSHEIRTPLNAIIGFSDAMLSGVGGKITVQKHKEYLADIRDSGEHLATVIKDILDLSKIEAGKWRLTESEFLLDECIREALKMLNSQIEKKSLKFEYQPDQAVLDLKIFGDGVAIKRIFINLFSNAIKFTPSGGRIGCRVERLRNGRVTVEISDTGIGIPKERLSHVLNPFEQSHKEYDLNEEGTGLGLSIVKNLAELHNVKFTLDSEVGVGTKATIDFPSKRIRN